MFLKINLKTVRGVFKVMRRKAFLEELTKWLYAARFSISESRSKIFEHIARDLR